MRPERGIDIIVLIFIIVFCTGLLLAAFAKSC